MPKASKTKTEPLYWKDQYQKEFSAKIIEKTKNQIVLDKTIFYPAGGGQTFDIGYIQKKEEPTIELKITGVEYGDDNKIIHFVEGKKIAQFKEGDEITGKIDWQRRFELMKSHTSQHILSAKIEQLCKVKTLKATIEAEEVTVYLEQKLDREKIADIISKTNEFLLSERQVKTSIYRKKDIPADIKSNLRGNLQEKASEQIRVVSVESLDNSLCGGLHIKNTSEIGFIFLTDFRGDIINYVHGRKAINYMSQNNIMQIAIAKLLAAKPSQIEKRVTKILSDNSELKDLNSSLNKIVLEKQIKEIRENPLIVEDIKIISADFHFAERKFVLQQIGPVPEDSVFMFIVKGPLLVLLTEVPKLSANDLIQDYCKEFNIKGGGSEKIAQAAITEPQEAMDTMIKIIKKKIGLK